MNRHPDTDYTLGGHRLEQPPQAERSAYVQRHEIEAVWREFDRRKEWMDKTDRFKERVADDIDKIKDEQIEIKATLRDMGNSVNSILDDSKWLRRTMTNLLIGGSFSAIIGVVVFFFQKGWGDETSDSTIRSEHHLVQHLSLDHVLHLRGAIRGNRTTSFISTSDN